MIKPRIANRENMGSSPATDPETKEIERHANEVCAQASKTIIEVIKAQKELTGVRRQIDMAMGQTWFEKHKHLNTAEMVAKAIIDSRKPPARFFHVFNE